MIFEFRCHIIHSTKTMWCEHWRMFLLGLKICVPFSLSTKP